MKKLIKISLVMFFIFVFSFSNSRSAEQDKDLQKEIRMSKKVPSLEVLTLQFIGKMKSKGLVKLFNSFKDLVIQRNISCNRIECLRSFSCELRKMAVRQYGVDAEERRDILPRCNPVIRLLLPGLEDYYLLSIQDLLDESEGEILFRTLRNGQISFDFKRLSLTTISGFEFLERIEDVRLLTFSCNNIKELTSPIMNLRNLRFLDFEGNKLTDLQPELFVNLPILENLNLSNNKIKEFKNRVVVDCPKLKEISLAMNPLEVIERDAFIGAINLETLAVGTDHNFTEESRAFLFSLKEGRGILVLDLMPN